MKVWVTKYALSDGIQEYEAERLDNQMVKITFGRTTLFVTTPFWHENRKAAVEHAIKMRAQKLMSLKRKIIKLESLTFD